MGSDSDDFLQFATTRSAGLFRTAWLLCGDWHLAEDLVQITLGRLYRSWGSVVRADNPDAYARAVLLRGYLSHRRRRCSGERPTAVLPEGTGPQPDDALRLTLLGALAQLPPRDRAVLVLRYWEDLSVQQTADELGMSAGAVRNRTHRALPRLRDLLNGDLSELKPS